MFRDVPECSGMFRNVLGCSGIFHVPGFIDDRLNTLMSVNGFYLQATFCTCDENVFCFLSEVLTFVVGPFSFRNSRIIVFVCSKDRRTSLNFCVESFSQQNCLGKRFKVSFVDATFLFVL